MAEVLREAKELEEMAVAALAQHKKHQKHQKQHKRHASATAVEPVPDDLATAMPAVDGAVILLTSPLHPH